jgi:hypothetical protein
MSMLARFNDGTDSVTTRGSRLNIWTALKKEAAKDMVKSSPALHVRSSQL